ncbi:MAG: histidine phosphatase family protein [Sphingomonadaceae bacterium]|nr:histidine phosphatase family protein [Sphingomonadaceae bacterium]
MTDFVLHLLRHGEPEGAGRLIGRSDAAPLPSGVAACVDRAGGLAVNRLVASDLTRARAAGEALSRMNAIPLMVDARWRELDFGAWDGLLTAQVDSHALGRFWDDPDSSPPPGGERWSAMQTRVSAAIAGLSPQTTLVVTHAGAMRAALALLCGFDHSRLWAFDLPYAALLTLRVWPGDTPSAQIIGLRT